MSSRGEGGASSTGKPRVLFTEGEIRAKVRELGEEIRTDLLRAEASSDPTLFVGMLRGSLFFMADLIRTLPDAQVEFLAISSFSAGGGRPGRVRIEKDLDVEIAGRHVIVVEDVVDTGFTLSYLMSELDVRGPASIEVATLLDKRARRIIDIPVRFSGFDVGDEFVLGYGLDHSQRYRNAPFIFAADDLDSLVADPDHYMAEMLELMRGGEVAQREAR